MYMIPVPARASWAVRMCRLHLERFLAKGEPLKDGSKGVYIWEPLAEVITHPDGDFDSIVETKYDWTDTFLMLEAIQIGRFDELFEPPPEDVSNLSLFPEYLEKMEAYLEEGENETHGFAFFTAGEMKKFYGDLGYEPRSGSFKVDDRYCCPIMILAWPLLALTPMQYDRYVDRMSTEHTDYEPYNEIAKMVGLRTAGNVYTIFDRSCERREVIVSTDFEYELRKLGHEFFDNRGRFA